MRSAPNMTILSSTQRPSSAFTVIEVMISVSVLTITLAAIFGIFAATKLLFVNGSSLTTTGHDIRKIYDELSLALFQTPSQYAEPMRIDVGTKKLYRQRDAPSEALAYCVVTAGPLALVLGKDGQPDTKGDGDTFFKVEIAEKEPGLTTDTVIVSAENQEILPGHYLKIFWDAGSEVPIASVVEGTGQWDITTSEGYDGETAGDDIDPPPALYDSRDITEPVAVYVLRYDAFVIVENLQGSERDGLIRFENLEVTLREANASSQVGSAIELQLPDDYQNIEGEDRKLLTQRIEDARQYVSQPALVVDSNHPRLSSPTTGDTAQIDGYLPFFRSVGTSNHVRINLAVESVEYRNVRRATEDDVTFQFYRASALDNRRLVLKSNSL